MDWFYITNSTQRTIAYFPSYDQAYLSQFALDQWQCQITPAAIPKLNTKELMQLLLELSKGLEAGLKLHQTLLYITQDNHHKKIRQVCTALDAALLQGVPFNLAFKAVVHQELHHYCDLFVANSTPEQLHSNLARMHAQITQVSEWQTSLIKTAIYPTFIIQTAMIMWLTNNKIQTPHSIEFEHAALFYLAISTLQLLLFYLLKSRFLIQFIDYCSYSFRLNKFFSLLAASLEVGNNLQTCFAILPRHFSSNTMRQDLLLVYYKLRLGNSYTNCFPKYWFPKESLLALNASEHSGDINRALLKAAQVHKKHWQQQLNIMEKISPIFALLIAGGFVSQTLIDIYRPLLELS